MSSSKLAAGLRCVRDKLALQQRNLESDEQLLDAFLARREDSAFAALVYRHGPMVLQVCRRVLGHPQDAEDAFQAVFLVLARNPSSLRNKASLASFLHGTAFRLAMKAKQAAARRRKHESQSPPRSPSDPSSDLLWREVRELLDEEIARLPDIYRSVFVLFHLENLGRAEVAKRLGLTERTVSSRLTEARKRLSQRLARRGVEFTALLAASALAPAASSAVPSGLMASTMKAVWTTKTGEGLAGAVSASVVELVKNGSPILSLGKAKLAMLLLAVSLMGGVALMHFQQATVPNGAPPALEKAKAPAPARAAGKEEQKDAVAFAGRVLGPDGKAVAGAKVYYYFITHQEEIVSVRAITDAQGRFAFTLTPKDIPLSADAERDDPRKTGCVVVKADGFTFAWRSFAKQQTDLTLRVAADDTPLTGRIIDLQGKPLAGVRVSAWSVAAPEKGDLTPFVKAIQSREAFYNACYKHVPNHLENPFYWRPRVSLLPATTTDAEGRFRLHGFAKEQLVELRIEGAAMETQDVYVMTRPAPRDSGSLLSTPRNKDPFFGPGKSVVVLANGFGYPVPPGLTVAGTVRDADTKRPIPRAIIESYVLAGTKLAQNTIYHTVADTQGRYRFTGLPRGKGNRIRIRPPADQPYIPFVKEVPAVKLFTEATVDASLHRGVWVDVTTADKATGRPVPGSVSYFVHPEKPNPQNPFEQPFSDSYNTFMAIRNDGTFRFAAVPQRAVLAFRTNYDKYPIAREAETIRLPGGHGISPSNFHAFAQINPKLGDAPVKVKFVLDAGRIVKGGLLDPEGRPLSGALAAGLNIEDWEWEPQRPLQTADFTALGLHPDRPRLLCFVHTERKLAGSVVVRGDEKKPIAVKLVPWATVSGRLLDAEGKPIPKATLWFTEVPVRKRGQPMSLDTGLLVLEHSAYKPNTDPRTDQQGRFRIEGLIPRLKYNLALMDMSGARRIEQIKWPGLVFTKRIFKPGETIELGDVKLQPFPKRDR